VRGSPLKVDVNEDMEKCDSGNRVENLLHVDVLQQA
jgi:hypothetical protein